MDVNNVWLHSINLNLWATLVGAEKTESKRMERLLHTGIEFILLSFVQAKKGAAKLARQTPATWHQTPRSSTTSGSSYRSSTPPSTAWVRSTTCPPWPEPGLVKRKTSWPPGTRLHLLPSYIFCTKSEPRRLFISICQAWVGILRGFQSF